LSEQKIVFLGAGSAGCGIAEQIIAQTQREGLSEDAARQNVFISNNLLELRNLVQVAELIVRCAMMRKESRGLHFTLDYPQQLA
ncbi:hypothetical protein MJM04_34510, partial [Salmonella enterica subsp. enterica serovar Cerro]|nr:hypothetical protein [Salmonella enterica subsp. enterica serovar Cerro]